MKALLIFILIASIVSIPHTEPVTPETFFVFVGEKISVESFSPEEPEGILMDAAFIAKYKVITTLYGKYSSDTIQFEAYDHYGIPAFSRFQYSLLFVSNHEGKWYHEKYMYNAVYPTKNGRWAGFGHSSDYSHPDNKNTTIKPEPIEFNDSIYVLLDTIAKKKRARFGKPYYLIKSNKAYPALGNYIEELFSLKKNGCLKARGLF
jgi:hypothetical protein